MDYTSEKFGTKKALCILFAFILALSGVFILRNDVSAAGDNLKVTAVTDKSSYGLSDTVGITVSVRNTSYGIPDTITYRNIIVAPATDQYYLAGGDTCSDLGDLEEGTAKSADFNLKISEKADNLNIFQKIILFFRYLFKSKTALSYALSGTDKKTVTVSFSQGGSKRNVSINVYFTEDKVSSSTEPASLTVPVGPESGGQPLTVTMLDVGQGLSILVRSNDEYMIYDGGGRSHSSYVVAYLKAHGITNLRYLVASHYDEDHISGLVGVLNTTTVGTAICPDYTTDTAIYSSFITKLNENGAAVEHPEAGTVYSLGSAKIKTLTPAKSSFSSDNNKSLAVSISYGKFSCIITGDCETEAEKYIVDNGYATDCDLYVAGHHGSSSSSSEYFISTITPEYSFISCGADNSYGHPTAKTLATFEKYDVKYFRSDEQGEVTCATDGITYNFSCSSSANTTAGGINAATVTTETTETSVTTSPAAGSITAISGSMTVYYTKTGTKYHYANPCGSGTYYACTLDEAVAMGLTPCSKCVK